MYLYWSWQMLVLKASKYYLGTYVMYKDKYIILLGTVDNYLYRVYISSLTDSFIHCLFLWYGCVFKTPRWHSWNQWRMVQEKERVDGSSSIEYTCIYEYLSIINTFPIGNKGAEVRFLFSNDVHSMLICLHINVFTGRIWSLISVLLAQDVYLLFFALETSVVYAFFSVSTELWQKFKFYLESLIKLCRSGTQSCSPHHPWFMVGVFRHRWWADICSQWG
jgi:hypothetical protein